MTVENLIGVAVILCGLVAITILTTIISENRFKRG